MLLKTWNELAQLTTREPFWPSRNKGSKAALKKWKKQHILLKAKNISFNHQKGLSCSYQHILFSKEPFHTLPEAHASRQKCAQFFTQKTWPVICFVLEVISGKCFLIGWDFRHQRLKLDSEIKKESTIRMRKWNGMHAVWFYVTSAFGKTWLHLCWPSKNHSSMKLCFFVQKIDVKYNTRLWYGEKRPLFSQPWNL